MLLHTPSYPVHWFYLVACSTGAQRAPEYDPDLGLLYVWRGLVVGFVLPQNLTLGLIRH